MSAAVNRVILLGNLGNDPELRTTQSGQPVANFNLATNERFQKDGEWVDSTEWHRIVVWAKTAENCAKYLTKGSQVFLEGKLQTRKWQDKEGRDVYTTEIVAFNVQFLSGDKAAGSGGAARPPHPAESGGNEPVTKPSSGGNDDFPFAPCL